MDSREEFLANGLVAVQDVQQQEGGEEARQCPICYLDLRQPTETPCSHRFCSECICTWLADHNSCPACRSTFFYLPACEHESARGAVQVLNIWIADAEEARSGEDEIERLEGQLPETPVEDSIFLILIFFATGALQSPDITNTLDVLRGLLTDPAIQSMRRMLQLMGWQLHNLNGQINRAGALSLRPLCEEMLQSLVTHHERGPPLGEDEMTALVQWLMLASRTAITPERDL